MNVDSRKFSIKGRKKIIGFFFRITINQLSRAARSIPLPSVPLYRSESASQRYGWSICVGIPSRYGCRQSLVWRRGAQSGAWRAESIPTERSGTVWNRLSRDYGNARSAQPRERRTAASRGVYGRHGGEGLTRDAAVYRCDPSGLHQVFNVFDFYR